MKHNVDLLLSCGHIIHEPLEATIFLPNVGEERHCTRHKRAVIISKVGTPFWVEDENEKPQINKQGVK